MGWIRTSKQALLGGFAVAATYIYFLLFSQFAFLELCRSQHSEKALLPIMASIGVMGLIGSLLSSWLLNRMRPEPLLKAGFILCGLVAFSALAGLPQEMLIGLAAMMGLSLGVVTVSLATSLKVFTGAKILGPVAAWGTGLAYAVCNVPMVFHGTAVLQTAVAGTFALVAAGLLFLAEQLPWAPPNLDESTTDGRARLGMFLAILASFLVLIWLDSALFFVIQHTDSLKTMTWVGSGRTSANAGFHLLAALMTGYFLRRLKFASWLFLAFGCLATSGLLLIGERWQVAAAPLYVIGVSIYSTCLVAYPGLLPEVRAPMARSWRTGWVFGVAGWVGSAMGIGMVQDLYRIPLLFILASALTLILVHAPAIRRKSLPALVLMAVGLFLWPGFTQQATSGSVLDGPVSKAGLRLSKSETAIPDPELGRQVYINEGCIHCHSQYVRPGTDDELKWGPAVPVAAIMNQNPPLIGNRRQGPDLLNVGNRRGWDWQRQHLKDPRSLAKHSMMPSYEYLFGDRRGEDLIAFLQSLGQSTFADRQKTIAEWEPETAATPINFTKACALYLADCSPCHGISSRGDGPLAEVLAVKPRDLLGDDWIFVNGSENEEKGLARVIKFGVPGTNMPGHESYSDEEVMGLVNYIQLLRHKAVASAKPIPAHGS